MDVKPRLILLCGLPGSGKTTRARLLADAIPAVRLCPDEWMAELGIDLFDEWPRARLEELFWNLAQDLLRLGQSVILESGFWSRSDRDEKRLAGRALGAAVELHFLDVPVEELYRRLVERTAAGVTPIGRGQLESWVASFQPPDRAELALFNVSGAVEPAP